MVWVYNPVVAGRLPLLATGTFYLLLFELLVLTLLASMAVTNHRTDTLSFFKDLTWQNWTYLQALGWHTSTNCVVWVIASRLLDILHPVQHTYVLSSELSKDKFAIGINSWWHPKLIP